ncbi:hypothetical protein DL98DRAFT_596981 [Cadophora sp. DSE1049]|nr:hypothetical protein DL98DRAFT_596981 [Cadophora sp. DSE1049]
MDNPWNYPVLPSDRSIRILRLEGGSKNDELVGSVWAVSLDDPNRATYEALSYVWGNPVPAETMTFNGIPGKEISPALDTALRAFRLPILAILLWIDALCINQQNIEERGQQVSMMGEYMLEPSIQLFGSVKLMNDEFVGKFETFSLKRNATRGFPEPKDRRWTGLVDLFSRSWFERVWIIQEFGLSSDPTFIIGKQHVPKATFLDGIMWLFYSGYSDGIPKMRLAIAQACQVMRCAPRTSDMRWPLLRLLGDARTFNATDPRDKILGVLGLSEEGNETSMCPLLRPDYKKTLVQVLSDATRHFLECRHGDGSQDGKLAVFSYVIHTKKYVLDSKYPSWILRCDKQATVVDLSSRKEIVPRGFQPGVVTSVPKFRTKGSPPISEARGQWLRLKKLWNDLVNDLDKHEDLNHFAMVFAQSTSMGGCIEKIKDRPNADDFVAYCLENLREEGHNSSTSEHRSRSDFKAFPLPAAGDDGDADLMRTCVTQHTLFTIGSRIATGPDTVSVGDVVVILYGGDVPFVLRPEKDYYTLVGECYLYGSMEGEALQEKEEKGIEDEWFLLR